MTQVCLLWVSTIMTGNKDRICMYMCMCMQYQLLHFSVGLGICIKIQSSHAGVCLWQGSKIVFAAHSHMREGNRRSFQCSTWKSINPIQTAPRRQLSNNLWWVRNLFMFVIAHWKINNLHNWSHTTLSAQNTIGKHTRNWFAEINERQISQWQYI